MIQIERPFVLREHHDLAVRTVCQTAEDVRYKRNLAVLSWTEAIGIMQLQMHRLTNLSATSSDKEAHVKEYAFTAGVIVHILASLGEGGTTEDHTL